MGSDMTPLQWRAKQLLLAQTCDALAALRDYLTDPELSGTERATAEAALDLQHRAYLHLSRLSLDDGRVAAIEQVETSHFTKEALTLRRRVRRSELAGATAGLLATSRRRRTDAPH